MVFVHYCSSVSGCMYSTQTREKIVAEVSASRYGEKRTRQKLALGADDQKRRSLGMISKHSPKTKKALSDQQKGKQHQSPTHAENLFAR
jgi:hypothetical protein